MTVSHQTITRFLLGFHFITIYIKEVFYAHLSVHQNYLKAFPATSQSLTSNLVGELLVLTLVLPGLETGRSTAVASSFSSKWPGTTSEGSVAPLIDYSNQSTSENTQVDWIFFTHPSLKLGRTQTFNFWIPIVRTRLQLHLSFYAEVSHMCLPEAWHRRLKRRRVNITDVPAGHQRELPINLKPVLSLDHTGSTHNFCSYSSQIQLQEV